MVIVESLQEFLDYIVIEAELMHRKAKHSVTVLAQVGYSATRATGPDDVYVIDIYGRHWTTALRAFSSVHVHFCTELLIAVGLFTVLPSAFPPLLRNR